MARVFVKIHLLPGGTLISDEFSAYSDFGWAGRRVSVNHKIGEYVKDGAGTNGAESFNAQAKRTIRDTYRHTSPKYFHRYLNEIAGRYNIRHLDPEEQMRYLTAGMMRKRLTHQDLLATEVPPAPFTHHRSKERANLSGTANEGQPLSAGAPLFRVKISLHPRKPQSSPLPACRADRIIPPHPVTTGLQTQRRSGRSPDSLQSPALPTHGADSSGDSDLKTYRDPIDVSEELPYPDNEGSLCRSPEIGKCPDADCLPSERIM